MAKYPRIECDNHKGDPLPGYVVCSHVIRRPKQKLHVVRPGDGELGVVLCDACHLDPDKYRDNYWTTACVHCVLEWFDVPL